MSEASSLGTIGKTRFFLSLFLQMIEPFIISPFFFAVGSVNGHLVKCPFIDPLSCTYNKHGSIWEKKGKEQTH